LVTALDRAVTNQPVAGVGTALFLLGQTAGFVLLGIALWRAQVLPAWLGIVLAASGPAHVLLGSLGNLGLASAWMITAIAYVGAAPLRPTGGEQPPTCENLIVGPAGGGQTARILVPDLLQHRGPAVVTSVKTPRL
jgi:hypothetical protein